MRTLLPPWMLFALGSAFFAGLTAIFGKVGVTGIPSNLATFLRTWVVLAFAGTIVAARGEWQNPLRLPSRALVFLVLSALATGASWLCYFRALKLGDAARVAPIDKLSVVLVAIFGVLLLGEKLSAPNWLGVAMIGAGAILVAYQA